MGKLSRLRLKPRPEKKWQREGVTAGELALLTGNSPDSLSKNGAREAETRKNQSRSFGKESRNKK